MNVYFMFIAPGVNGPVKHPELNNEINLKISI